VTHLMQASNAYRATASRRTQREQEADVFRRATGALRAAKGGDSVGRARALADNRRLWSAVIDLVRDPANVLPASLRASIVSVGLAVQREMDAANPNFEFLISINENIAAGLAA
jgi:flagellar protein FlaF